MNARQLQERLGVVPDGMLGPLTYAALFARMGATYAAADLGKGAAVHFPAYQIDRPLRIAHWLAQFGHESAGFRLFIENLNYSAGRMCAVWPSRFPTLAAAKPFANNPQALAERVYGGRMGNDQPGDGWRFRGRGPQLTGRANYTACAARTGLDLIGDPDLAADPEHFVHIASDFWAQSCCNPLADADDIVTITKRINGGKIGMEDRRRLLARAMKVLL